MSLTKPIHRIGIVGTGLIGSSWVAQYLARGFDVIATNPDPSAETKSRENIDAAWKKFANHFGTNIAGPGYH
jgi:carnitine 3-dehydrogenase